jgi:hypothetical protein
LVQPIKSTEIGIDLQINFTTGKEGVGEDTFICDLMCKVQRIIDTRIILSKRQLIDEMSKIDFYINLSLVWEEEKLAWSKCSAPNT